ncbi:MAG: DUF4320 family protein [Lachnospiraceae bacterium]|nr:DUF4320 family protein [Lachnospiraceae bacterium]
MRSNFAVIIPILAAILLAIILFVRYLIRLKRAVSEDSTPTDREHRFAAPSEVIPWILIAVLVIWNAMSLSKISAMNLKVDNLVSNTNSLMNQMGSMSRQIDDLEEQLKAETDLLHEYGWSFGDFFGNTGKVRIDFTLAPNSYSEKSVFTLQFGEETAECEQKGAGRYTATVYLDVFKTVDTAPVVTLTEDGVIRTQILDDVPYGELWSLIFPNYEAEGANLKAALKNGMLSLKGSFALADFSKAFDSLKVTKAELVKEVDGKEAGRTLLDLPEDLFDPLKVEVDDSFENFGNSSRLQLFLDTETSSGYSIRTELIRVSAENGFKAQEMSGMIEIFDPSGKSVVHTEDHTTK